MHFSSRKVYDACMTQLHLNENDQMIIQNKNIFLEYFT